MMKSKFRIIIALIILLSVVIIVIRSRSTEKQINGSKSKVINAVIGDVELTVTTTGVIEPQNRLEIKPSISGRVEEILVREGDQVELGDILVWMSSTERAALIDAARSQGEEALEYWEEAYKKTPIISPIDGKVIVRSVEPGQTITTIDAILVLSDRLVVSAQFDETDIGKVKIGQKAVITLDAYPDIRLEGVVAHIAYESEIVNNVTIYDVDILPKNIPDILRSGMSVTVKVTEKAKTNVIILPSNAIHFEGERSFVLVQEGRGNKISERDITVGLNNDKTAEVTSGLMIEDKVIVQEEMYLPKRKSSGSNPFMPFSRKRNDKAK